MFSRAQVRRVLQRVPGKQRLGVYRFLPFFFVLGGTMEWIMIKVRVGQETFYDVYRRKASERQYQRRLEDAPETESQQSIKSTNTRAGHPSGLGGERLHILL
ncbi:small integral membrane protein 4 isoform X1 [Rhinolophus ferrumequinum]|nr:small integral membrane protein 4 isoform X1 [Rhinolophus ferrumequinum]